MSYHEALEVEAKHLENKLLFSALMTVITDCSVTMSEVYEAKYSFRGLEDCCVYEMQPTKSTPNSPSPTRSVNEINNKVTTDQFVKLNKCFAKMSTDAILRSPILSAKLEKCNSEPNVSKETDSANAENTSNKCTGSPCQSSQSEHSLAGISSPCLRQSQKKLFLAFDEGDSFEVSKYLSTFTNLISCFRIILILIYRTLYAALCL
jgi:hypothetical protein